MWGCNAVPAGIETATCALGGLATILCMSFQVPLGAIWIAALTTFMLLFSMHFQTVLFCERKLRKWSVRASRAHFCWTTVEFWYSFQIFSYCWIYYAILQKKNEIIISKKPSEWVGSDNKEGLKMCTGIFIEWWKRSQVWDCSDSCRTVHLLKNKWITHLKWVNFIMRKL